MFIDSHCHIFYSDYDSDISEVVKNANDAGVTYIIVPGTDLETSKKAILLAEQFDCIYAAVGFHPHDAAKVDEQSLKEIEELSRHKKVVAIGEIGLDYFYDYSPREKQKEVLAQQIEIAVRRNLPIILHERESREDLMAIVTNAVEQFPEWRKEFATPHSRFPAPKGVFHCFSGDVALAWKVINMGFYISFPGPVTFPDKKDKKNLMAEVAATIYPDHFLLETDSPYLTPAPFRGKRNEPKHIPLIAEKIAQLQSLSVTDIGRATSVAVKKLFGVGTYPEPVFVYPMKNSLYINLTIRCNADCVFCDRKGEAIVLGHNLKIEREPTAEEVIALIGDTKNYDEIVFCGFGEPTIRLDALKEIAGWVKANGGKTRLNTDGHGSEINKRNIVPELAGVLGSVSISLNSIDKKQYGELMRLDAEKYFPAMVAFAKECVRNNIPTTMSVVALREIDTAQAKEFVEQEIGATFRSRRFF